MLAIEIWHRDKLNKLKLCSDNYLIVVLQVLQIFVGVLNKFLRMGKVNSQFNWNFPPFILQKVFDCLFGQVTILTLYSIKLLLTFKFD